jgi:hypothetical protein
LPLVERFELSKGGNRQERERRFREARTFMAVKTGSEPATPDPLPARIAELAARPEAARWARECAWVPSTGYCRRQPCSLKCVFRDQRTAEADRVAGERRKRRPSQLPGSYRPEPTRAALSVLHRFLARVLG